jgi:ABC-type glycerol-3-phosphate transport system substrate-binding protein
MNRAWIVAGLMLSALLCGCARYFHMPAAAVTPEVEAAAGSSATSLRVGPLPNDLKWLRSAIRLFDAVGAGPRIRLASASATADRGDTGPFAAAGVMGGAAPQDGDEGSRVGANVDLRFVILPLGTDQAAGLAPVPNSVEAAIAPAILSSARAAGQSGGRLVALPVSARWLALAWNPARLGDSPAPVPPHLEAWVDQLRELRRRMPEHAPCIAAWSEKEIAGAFGLLLAANGGRLLDDAGQPAFTGPAGEATIRLMQQLLEERLVQPTALQTTAEKLGASLTGPYAYWLCSSEALSSPGTTDRLAALRLSGLPMARERYHYPDATTSILAQFRGIAVPKGPRRAAAWRLARFLADPVVLRSAPPYASVLNSPPPSDAVLIRQARELAAQPGVAPWPDPPGLSRALGRFLHAALRRLLTPREALERAALQFRQPGALPEAQEEATGSSAPNGTDSATSPSAATPGSPREGSESSAPAPPPGYGPPTAASPTTPSSDSNRLPQVEPPGAALRPPGRP